MSKDKRHDHNRYSVLATVVNVVVVLVVVLFVGTP